MRTLQDTVTVKVPTMKAIEQISTSSASIHSAFTSNEIFEYISIHQCSLGPLAISSVVWDAGLLLIDFIIHLHDTLGEKDAGGMHLGENVIDLGCGTGLVGIAAIFMGVSRVLFSDAVSVELAESNFSMFKENHAENVGRAVFVQYDWKDIAVGFIPIEFKPNVVDSSIIWDTVILSDVLYESSCHQPLLQVLRQLPFRKLLISYKIRHAEVEMLFFEELSKWCTLQIVEQSSFKKLNISSSESLAGLFIIIAVPHSSS